MDGHAKNNNKDEWDDESVFQLPDGEMESSEPEDIAHTEPVHVDPDIIIRNYARAAEKVRSFPHSPGVYLMKDEASRVIYIGKAKDLRNRAGSYFHLTALGDSRTLPIVTEIRDIDFIPAKNEIDAILMEARLIKDIRPKFNRDLKDDKSFPYLQITSREDFPRVEITRTPREHGVRLFGPFPSASHLRGALLALQKVFRFRTCTLRLHEDDPRWQWFRPCLLASIGQCTAPCAHRIGKVPYRRSIRRLVEFLSGQRKKLFRELHEEMTQYAQDRRYEDAAEIRDQIAALESLEARGKVEEHVQPEVFYVDPRRGVTGLQKVFKLETPPRVVEGVDIAHLSGQDTVASLVRFIDGIPFKPGYRRYRIRTVSGVDDFASIAEVVSRRFAVVNPDNPPPDILLIDGGKGQLHAACEALAKSPCQPKIILGLAKREEEIFLPNESEPIRLSRHSYALRLLQYVRDEAHRFAQHYHHILRKKSTLGDDE